MSTKPWRSEDAHYVRESATQPRVWRVTDREGITIFAILCDRVCALESADDQQTLVHMDGGSYLTVPYGIEACLKAVL